jgi:hypothetical protein
MNLKAIRRLDRMNQVGRLLVTLACGVIPSLANAQGSAAERFENATAGISLVRPAGWQTASLQTVQENRARVQLSDSELQAAMQKFATAPLFVFMKHPEPHPDLNPSIQITLRPMGQLAGMPPADVMKIAVTAMQNALANFTFVTPIENTRLAGLPAAYMRARYTAKTADREFKALSRLWLVPRGAFMFLIGMSGPAEGSDVSEAEFTETLQSIRIDN